MLGNNRIIRNWGLLLGALLLSSGIFNPVQTVAVGAEDEADMALAEMSLEELLNVTVVSASKREESLSNSPSIISSISMDDMRSYGVHTLKDALAHVPGVLIQDTPVGSTAIMIRGLSETFNQKVLFLLEGVPEWMSSHGDIPLLGMPVEMIDRIEVIRGPGSVIYGTNASAGVINVILKKDVDRTMVSARGGGQGLWNGELDYSKKLDQGHVFAAASIQGMADGYDAEYPETVLVFPFSTGVDENLDPFPTSGEIVKKEEYFNAVAGLKYGSFNFLGNVFKSTQNGLGGAPLIFQRNDLIYRGYLLHGDWTYEHDAFDVNIFADHNVFFLELDIDNFLGTIDSETNIVTSTDGKQQYVDPYENNSRSRFGATGSIKLSERGSIFMGVENEIRRAGEYHKTDDEDAFLALQSEKTSVSEFSVFGQLDLTFNRFRTVLGARFVDNEFAGSRVSPRASLIFNIDEKQSIKLLYSEGFNSPVISQQDLIIPFVVEGNPDLEAELIRTTDLAYSYAGSTRIFIINGYFISTDNVIDRVLPEGGQQPQYTNTAGFERWGAEVDFQETRGALKLFSNLAYNHEGNTEIDQDPFARFVPKFTFNLGARYQLGENHVLGIAERFWSERGEVDGQNITNLNYTYKRGKYGFLINLYNVFDQDIQNPDVNSNRISSIPSGAGRSFYAGVKYEF